MEWTSVQNGQVKFVKVSDRGDIYNGKFTQGSGLFCVQYRQILRLNVIVYLYRILYSEHTGLIEMTN